MRNRLRQDRSTPEQRRWLDRYAKTCPSRRGFMTDEKGHLFKRINKNDRNPMYGCYSGSPEEQWAWVRSEVLKFERRERVERKRDAMVNVGVFI